MTAVDPYTVEIDVRRAVRRRRAPARQPADPAAPRARAGARSGHAGRAPGTCRRRPRRWWGSARSSSPVYDAGQRLVFDRNPRYFRKAGGRKHAAVSGSRPIEIVPEQNAELLRLEAGQIDMTMSEIAPEAYAPLKRAADAGRVKLVDLGRRPTTPNSLWFNLKPGAFGGDPRALAPARRAAAGDLAGGRSPAVRRHGVPGRGGAGLRTDYDGNKKWYWRGLPQARTIRAAKQARRIGLRSQWRRLLEDAPVAGAFTLITQKGRPDLERGCGGHPRRTEEDRRRSSTSWRSTAARSSTDLHPASYEAVYFSALATDTDPALNPDFWFSFGSAHLWNMSEKTPATDWERRIDELMAKQIATPDDGRAQAAVRRGAAGVRRARAGRLLRGAAHLRGVRRRV